jgi:PleD family two-component response regulator
MPNEEPQPSLAAPPKPRILLVEDERLVREHLAQALSDEYLIETASNGLEALSAVLRVPPALIVTDVVMPGLDGIEMLKTLRSTRRTQAVPVLLISGRILDEQRLEAFREGADGFLAKPYTEQELRVRIGSMLQALRRNEETGRKLQSSRDCLRARVRSISSLSLRMSSILRVVALIEKSPRATRLVRVRCS